MRVSKQVLSHCLLALRTLKLQCAGQVTILAWCDPCVVLFVGCRRARPRVRLNKPQAAAVRAWIDATAGGKCRPASGQAGSTADVCLAEAKTEKKK